MPSSREITVCLDVKRNRKWKHQAISACGESEKTVVNLKISSTLYSYYLSFCTINCSLQLCLGSFNWKEKLPCPSAWQDCPKVPPFLLTFLRSGWQSLSNRALRYSSLSKPPKSDSEYWDSWICCIGHTYISSGLKILLGKHQTEQPGRAETATDPHQRSHEYGNGVCIPCRHTGMQTYMYLYRDASRSTLLKEPLHTHSQHPNPIMSPLWLVRVKVCAKYTQMDKMWVHQQLGSVTQSDLWIPISLLLLAPGYRRLQPKPCTNCHKHPPPPRGSRQEHWL